MNDPRYDTLWEKIGKMTDKQQLSLFHYIYGWCHNNKEFMDGIDVELTRREST